MKWKADVDNAWVTWVRIGFGQMMYLLYVPNHAAPIGMVWGMGGGETAKDGRVGRFDVFGSFVQPWARRQGVRSKINDSIFQHFCTIITSHGSKQGGADFLKAKKYRRNQDLHCWYLVRRKNQPS